MARAKVHGLTQVKRDLGHETLHQEVVGRASLYMALFILSMYVCIK
jgi:hypothetical protein